MLKQTKARLASDPIEAFVCSTLIYLLLVIISLSCLPIYRNDLFNECRYELVARSFNQSRICHATMIAYFNSDLNSILFNRLE